MPDQEKLEKLKKLMEITTEGLTKAEFLSSFKQVIDHVLKTEIKLIEKMNKLMNELKGTNNSLNKATQGDFSGLAEELNRDMVKALKDQKNSLDFIYDKMRRVKNGINGKDGLDGTDGKDGSDGKDGKQGKDGETGEKGEKGKDGVGGGGTSAIGIANAAKYFVKTEAPSGDIDGVNLAYTVAKPIFAVLAFVINGEYVAQLPNYTIANKTVTFSTAIPAAYNGKDIEIVYI